MFLLHRALGLDRAFGLIGAFGLGREVLLRRHGAPAIHAGFLFSAADTRGRLTVGRCAVSCAAAPAVSRPLALDRKSVV